MNHLRSQLIILILAAFVSATPVKAAEKAQPIFDSQTWKLGWSQNQDGGVFEEYVLEGETVEAWSELVTIQFFPGLQDKTSLESYEGVVKSSLSSVCPGAIWEPLEQSEDSRMWTWTISACPDQPDQSEVARLVKTGEGFHLWHYAVKESPLPVEKRETWISNLQKMKIEN